MENLKSLIRDRRPLLLALAIPALLGAVSWLLPWSLGWPGTLLRIYAVTVALALSLKLLERGTRLLLWRVSRRLAFSYFLLGVLPVLLATLLALVALYLVGGLFIGHLYRDAAGDLRRELTELARQQVESQKTGTAPPRPRPGLAVASYIDGRQIVPRDASPANALTWQSWWVDHQGFVVMPDGQPTLITAVADGRRTALAYYQGDLAVELRGRSHAWIELIRSDEDDTEGWIRLRFPGVELPLLRRRTARDPTVESFLLAGEEPRGWQDRALLQRAEVTPRLLELETGKVAARHVTAYVSSSPRAVVERLRSPGAEADASGYLTIAGLSLLLFDIYIAALAMALFMILGLSKAVNRLTEATERLQKGDFTTQIEVRRRDQIGALQRSFNQMASNLGTLVATTAQKESLERQLAVAADLQRSLLPRAPKLGDHIEFATFFEPSAAVGGDYYDILPIGDARVAIFIADASGHGLSAGLRMAMLKSALQLLIDEQEAPLDILRRLDRLQRNTQRRGFVTASLTLIDTMTGAMTVSNAGHPPTYVVRDQGVQEIAIPSPPLGSLGQDYGQRQIDLRPGDRVVWLSDGLVEATDEHHEAFGFTRTVAALESPAASALETRDQLLEAVRAHTEGRLPDDDLTLVVMRYGATAPA